MVRKNYLYEILLISSVLTFTSCNSIYKLYKHPQNTTAKCIDGSPSALYISQGQSDQIMLYFEGGGMCFGTGLSDTIQNCYNRSKTALGSSKSYAQTVDLNEFSILSNDKTFNPLYWSWTKVYIPYCDGVLHQGTKLNSIQFKGNQLYLRGMNITLTHFEYLNSKYNLYDANKIVLTGTSAGAMAALAWSNTVHKRMKNPSGLLTIFDSGQFYSQFHNPFTNSTPGVDFYKAIKTLAFSQQQPPFEQCLKSQTRQDCDKFGVLINYILPPVFAIQSSYDLFAIRNILLLSCPLGSFPGSLQRCNNTQMSVIEDYRQKSMQSWKNLTRYEKNGIWAISCAQHGFLYRHQFMNEQYYLVPSGTGSSALQILTNMINNSGPKVVIDEVKWPNNSGCSAYRNIQKLYVQ